MSDEAVSVLVRAKEKIAAGWIQGRMESPEGVCVIGALTAIDSAAYWALFHTMGHGDHQAELLLDHNDRCLKTQADALDWFDRAIAYAKEMP